MKRGATREFRAWTLAKARCDYKGDKNFVNYGGRGITMASEWRDDFPRFLADMGLCPPGHSIERNDNDGNYEPGNCRWATAVEQARNRRSTVRLTHNGETLCAVAWDERRGFRRGTVRNRLANGWSIERALTEPWSSAKDKEWITRCHPGAKYYAHGLCRNCYKRWLSTQPGRPAPCHPDKPHVSREMCEACYTRWKRARRRHSAGAMP